MSGLLKLNRTSLIVAIGAYGLLCLAGCGADDKNKKGTATGTTASTAKPHDHDHDHGHDHGGDFGDLVEVGAEDAHLGVKLDSATGKLTVVVLDASGKKEVPVAMTELKLQFMPKAGEGDKSAPKGEPIDLDLKAVDAKDGKTADFAGTSDKLKGVKAFTGVIANLKIDGKSIDAIPVKYPSGHKH